MKPYKIIKENGIYYVIRKSDGGCIGSGQTKKEAIKDAIDNLKLSMTHEDNW